MTHSSTGSEITRQIVAKAKSLGADLAGVAHVDPLKKSPSHLLSPQMAQYAGVGVRETPNGVRPGEVVWPETARSVVVIAAAHRGTEPELDWWYGKKSPPGNRVLMRINRELSAWVEENLGIRTHNLPYHIEKGGIFLKDAAVMAGLGCIGRSNLLVTPQWGPRIRLRAICLDREIEPTGPVAYDPCSGCDGFCRNACPQTAFGKIVFSGSQTEVDHFPGRDGSYSRPVCNMQMEKDMADAKEGVDPENGETLKIIKYCRRCELACPVGKGRALPR